MKFLQVGLIATAAISGSVQAQSTEKPLANSTFYIGEEMEIYGEKTHEKLITVAGSVDVVGRDQLENEHVNITMDLLKKVPGVYFSRFNQGIISADVAIRGFNAEGSMPHTKLLIDGIPSNLHNGFSEMDAVFPLDIDRLEVIKGNNDPRYGLNNLAGNINIHSREEDSGNRLEVLGGSFDTAEAQGFFSDDSDGFSQQYMFGHRQTAGYRDHADLKKTAAAGRWFWDLTESTELGLVTRYLDYDADAPGYLTHDEARRDPTQSADYAKYDQGNKKTKHVSVHWNQQLNDDAAFNFKAYVQEFDRQRWVRFTESGTQQERTEDERQSGFIFTADMQLSDQWQLSGGVDGQWQDNHHRRYKTQQRERIKDTRNHDFSYNNFGGFAQVEWQNHNGLTLVGGFRADTLSGDFDDVLNSQELDMSDYGTVVMPKFSALYDLTSEINLFANYGQSFQAGVGKSAFVKDGKDVDMSINHGWEGGVKWQPTDTVNLRLSRWQQDAEDELTAKDDGSGDRENIGETRRTGWDLAASWHATDNLTLWASYTLQEAKLTEPGAKKINEKGNWLRGVPDYTGSFGVNYQLTPALKTSLYGSYQGNYYISNKNEFGEYGQYSLVDFAVDYDLSWGSVGFRVNNIADRYTEYVYLLGTETIHSPGDGRSYQLSVSYDL